MASPTPVLQPAVVSAVSYHRKNLLPIRAGRTASSETRPNSSVPSASVSCTGLDGKIGTTRPLSNKRLGGRSSVSGLGLTAMNGCADEGL